MKTDKIYLWEVILNCLGKDLVIVAGDIEKVFKEDDIRKRAEDEQKVCKKHIEKYVAKLYIYVYVKRQNWLMQREAGGSVKIRGVYVVLQKSLFYLCIAPINISVLMDLFSFSRSESPENWSLRLTGKL